MKRIILLLTSMVLTASAQAVSAQPAACDEDCLKSLAGRFAAAAMQGKTKALPLSADAEIRENTALATLATSIWPKVRKIRSQMLFADPLTGNVVLRAGVELNDGKPAYVSTRLKRAATGKIVDVEIASDRSDQVVPAYVWSLNPLFTQVLPEDQRTDRIAMEAIVRRYFNALGTHQPTIADFDDEACDRYHSGTKITHVAASSVEGGGIRTCVSALQGMPPWEPANEQRVPIIDVERGVVLGVTLLHYPRLPETPTMYVTEVFKIIKGRIVSVDNIGLMQPKMESVGFVH